MKKLISILMLLCSVSLSGCGGSGGSGSNGATGSNGGGDNTPPAATTNTTQALKDVAQKIYDAQAAQEDLIPYISGVMTAFGVPPVGENDVATAQSRYSQGLPLFFDRQLEGMAEAYNSGSFVSLSSFIAAVNEQGAKQKGTNLPLTIDFLNQNLWDCWGAMQIPDWRYESGQVLPAFVIALGQERASRYTPQNYDMLSGDGLLDPLQFTLLLYGIMYSSVGPLPAPAAQTSSTAHNAVGGFVIAKIAHLVDGLLDSVQSALSPHIIIYAGGGSLQTTAPHRSSSPHAKDIAGWVADKVAGGVAAGEIGKFVETPLGAKDASQQSLCASMVLYGHKVVLESQYNNLYYHGDGDPWRTKLTATLTFMDDWYNTDSEETRWFLENFTNCNVPHQGPVAGKPVEWSEDGLEEHGDYDIQQATTDENGEAFATWHTKDETTPPECRTLKNLRTAAGFAMVKVSNLLPGWSTLERIVGFIKAYENFNTGTRIISINYYDSTNDATCNNPHGL